MIIEQDIAPVFVCQSATGHSHLEAEIARASATYFWGETGSFRLANVGQTIFMFRDQLTMTLKRNIWEQNLLRSSLLKLKIKWFFKSSEYITVHNYSVL
jgi:hypothetical protein